MQLSAIVLTLMASSASARLFTLFDNVNYNGPANTENRPDDNACCTLYLLALLCGSSTNYQYREPERQG